MDIPIYRAKKIDSDEYVVGYYSNTAEFLGKILRNKNGYINSNGEFWIIDPSTLAIHFPNMLDSEGNKIFASLSYGKGGDICKSVDKKRFKQEGVEDTVAILLDGSVVIGEHYLTSKRFYLKVKGIQ